MYFCFAHAARNWKSLNHEIKHKKKIGPTKYPREKNFGPMQYSRRHDGSKPTIARDPGNSTHSKWRHVKKLGHVMHVKTIKTRKKRWRYTKKSGHLSHI